MATPSGPQFLAGIDLYSAETTPSQQIGQIVWDGKTGKAFRYALNGAVALVKGNTLQSAIATDTQFDAMAIGTAGVVGDLSLQVTNGTTTVVPTQYRGGTIAVTTAGATVALGDEYTIRDITGTLTSGGALNVYTDRPLRYAYPTTTTKVDMKPSPWAGVLQGNGTTATAMPVGVVIWEIPASTATVFQYGWVQTHGVCSVLCDGTTMAIGSDLAHSITVAGAAGLYAVTSGRARIGYAMQANSSGHAIPAFLQID